MAGPGLTGQSLLHYQGAFNWIYLIELITNGILALFFLFYFNRVFGALLSYGIRSFTWYKFRVHIEIQAIQVSLLAGRVFFKGVRYHGDNVTIFVHSGFITWRYWYRNVQESEIFQDDNEASPSLPTPSVESKSLGGGEGTKSQRKKAPCRIAIEVVGVEGFLYNRSPAYDYIIENIIKREEARKEPPSSRPSDTTSEFPQDEKARHSGDSSESTQGAEPINPAIQSETSSLQAGTETKCKPPFFLRLFPVYVECKSGAVVLGNDNSQAIVTAKFSVATGLFDAATAGDLDIFKIQMGFEVTHPVIRMMPNVDFRKPQLIEAAALQSEQDTPFNALKNDKDHKIPASKRPKNLAWLNLLGLRRGSAGSIIANEGYTKEHVGPYVDHTFLTAQERWRGLTRYLDEDQQDQRQEWEGVEYARTSTIADISSLSFKFYWDIPGRVPQASNTYFSHKSSESCNINGCAPPDYGMELHVRSGTVNYGPWADRHRIVLQQIFFPMSYVDAVPEPKLKPGQTRLATKFNLFLNIEEEITVRIPFREPSKDWRWKGRASKIGGSNQTATPSGKRRRKGSKADKRATGLDVRPFSWFDLKVQPDSTISFSQDMFCREQGYGNKLHVDVSGLEILSSLNHGLLWRSERVGISADLSNPLQWNKLREWLFEITIDRLDLFLLRDHTFLLVDLIEDWSLGPPHDFFTFVPYQYLIKTTFNDFKLFLNTNDGNIINSPEDLDDNDFVILYGRLLNADLKIPIDEFRPRNQDITFDVQSYDLGFELSLPPKNTIHALLEDKNVATLKAVYLHGVYTNCSEIKAGLTETLNIDIEGHSLLLKFFGFFGRQLVKIKENYFGDNVNFRTLDEYQDLARRREAGEVVETPPSKSNDLDVILDIVAKDANILLPASLYNCDEHIKLRVDRADVDLRVSNYYLELMVNSSPLELSYTKRSVNNNQWVANSSGTQISIEWIKCYGHRLFGLPPSEPAYVDNWDIDAGDFIGECSSAFLEILVAAGTSLALSAQDAENASAIDLLPPSYGVTFVRFCCTTLRIWFRVDEAAFRLQTGQISGSFTDYAGRVFSEKLRMDIPDLSLACINSHDALHHSANVGQAVRPLAYLSTSLTFTMVKRSPEFEKYRQVQQDHIGSHDARTNRVPFLVQGRHGYQNRSRAHDPVSLPLPKVPGPLKKDSFEHSIKQASYASSSESLGFPAKFDPHANPSDHNTHIKGALRKATDVQTPSRPGLLQGSFNSKNSTLLRNDTTLSHTMLSSPFKRIGLFLDVIELDLSEVPGYRALDSGPPDGDLPLGARDDLHRYYEDDILQKNFMIHTQQGVNALCKAEAVLVIASLVEKIVPKDPERILDAFQATVFSEVLANYSQKTGENESINLSVRIPQFNARFVNMTDDSMKRSGPVSDQYDLAATNLNLVARAKSLPQRPDESDSKSLHTTLGSIRVSAQEGSERAQQDDVALESYIDDILVWMVDSDRTSVHASFRNAKAALASRKVEYLARLIHRTTMMADTFSQRFSRIAASQEFRLQSLIYQLTQAGDKFPDPLFITRPTHSIRSNTESIRASDSWKITARIRYIYYCLPEYSQTRLSAAYINDSEQIPSNAQKAVLHSLEKWRSWDTAQVRDSFAVRILYSSMVDIQKIHDRSKIPLSLAIQSRGIRFLIDPGPNQTEFLLHELAVGTTITPPLPPSAVQIFHEREESARLILIHIAVHDLALRVNWQLCELAEHILALFTESAPGDVQDDSSQITPMQPVNQQTSEPLKFHVVFAADSGLIRLDTINLSSTISTESVKFSLLGSSTPQDAEKMSINLQLASKSTAVNLNGHNGHQRSLLHFEVATPSLFISYQVLKALSRETDGLALVAASDDLNFEIREEVLGLLEIVNAVTTDEAAYFKRLADSHRALFSRNKSPAMPATLQDVPLKVNVALFLKTYNIGIAFLNDLAYSTTGDAGRLSIRSLARSQPQFQIEYDLKAHSHKLLTTATRKEVLAQLDMPPVNGTFNALITSRLVNVTALLSVEEINLDGSAIYAILNTFSSARVLSAIDSIKEDVRAVQEKIQTTFELAEKPKPIPKTKPENTFLFATAVAFAGLKISTSSAAISDKFPPARMLYSMGSLHLKAWNRDHDSLIAYPFPELRIGLNQMTLELQQIEQNFNRSAGSLTLGAFFTCVVDRTHDGRPRRNFTLSIDGPKVQLFGETGIAAVEILHHLQTRLKRLDLSREKQYLRRLRHLDTSRTIRVRTDQGSSPDEEQSTDALASIASVLSFDVSGIEIAYTPERSISSPISPEVQDLVFSLETISLLASTEAEAKLSIINLSLALVPRSLRGGRLPMNYALLPEIVFNVAVSSTETDHKITINAAGKSLDLRLDPHFIIPTIELTRSLSRSSNRVRAAVRKLDLPATTATTTAASPTQKRNMFGKKRLSHFLVDAEFAGAVVTLTEPGRENKHKNPLAALHLDTIPQHGKYGQFGSEESTSATMQTPGIAFKARYQDMINVQATMDVEVLIDGTNNVLYPSITPLIFHIANSVKEAVRNENASPPMTPITPISPSSIKDTDKNMGQGEELTAQADPSAIFGRTKLNIGLRIRKQELSLSCQPIAKVAATAKLEDIYMTINSIDSTDNGHFFAGTINFSGLSVSLRHVYSRETTFGFDIDSIIFSFMNSKHISGTNGISAILKINPSKMQVNAKQFQDILLFREIWIPPEIRHATSMWTAENSDIPQEFFVQRYQQVAASTAFSWSATVAIMQLSADIDLGQSIGKISLVVSNLWASSKKSTSSFQDLCVGVDRVSVSSAGRLSGLMDLEKVKVRTAITWPAKYEKIHKTPLVQGSIGFDQLVAKLAFDYQTFVTAHIVSFEFIMYNVREKPAIGGDRLVAILDGDNISAYCIAATPAICLSMGQAFERLIQEKEAAYAESLHEIEKFLRRKSSVYTTRPSLAKRQQANPRPSTESVSKMPHSLHTDVVVTLRSINIGAFPTTLIDHQVLRIEASDIQARFAASSQGKQVLSSLGLTLGQLRVALASIPQQRMPKTLGEITVEDVMANVAAGRGGVILRVPKVLATMQTWQKIDSKLIEYIFRTTLEGKIDVGWNYSRISFIRGMWETHSRTLASRLGKPLPESAVKITGAVEPIMPEEGVEKSGESATQGGKQQKITAVVNLPQSKYTYRALEPPIIDTPQLRDMGEATPPLEWIGLQRDKLPNVTHQIVIVTLLEIAKEVEDAYTRTLGFA